MKKGNRRGEAYAYNVKELRDHEIAMAEQAQQAYEEFVSRWQPHRPKSAPTAVTAKPSPLEEKHCQ